MSETLYLKWRPRTFRDVVGQNRVVEVLKNQSATDRFAHAYLLCGTRGTGKTTCARILAKAVNCRHKVDGDPCGVCDICRGIENGDYLDVIEMDAASNNGIEDMRDLKEKSIYNPSGGGKKVYIIDEVHMLSTAAFNGFLKLLEEPPEHVVFILATTDVQKLPATIISRCQRFDFRRIGEEDIAKRCLYVAGEEGIDLTPDGAMKIASLSDGALRNAISALEQLAGAGGRIDEAVVSEVLGLAGSEKLLAVASAVARCDTGEAMDALDAMYQRGVSANHFLGDLAMIFRDAAVTKAGAGAPLLGSGYDRDDLDEIAGRLGYERLIYHIGEINQAIAGLRTSANARVDTELCLIRLCNPVGRTPAALAARLDALEKKLSELELNPPAPREVPPKREAPRQKAEPAPRETPAAEAPPAPKPVPKEPAADTPITPARYRAELVRELKGSLPLLAYTQLMVTQLLEQGDYLVIQCSSPAQKGYLNEKTILTKIEEKASALKGSPVRAVVRLEGEEEKTETRDGFGELLAFGKKHPEMTDVL